MRQSQQKSSAFLVCSLYGKQCGPRSDYSYRSRLLTAPIGAVCCGSTPFASILNLSVMLGNYLQQTTFSDAFFFLGALRVKVYSTVTITHILSCDKHGFSGRHFLLRLCDLYLWRLQDVIFHVDRLAADNSHEKPILLC